MEAEQTKFEGWALIELYGHSREAGYVTTVYFGPAAMFRVDVPEIPARQETAKRPQWVGNQLCPAGTVVEADAIPGRTRYLGPGSIYAMNPATEELVRAAAARVERTIKIISMPDSVQLPAPDERSYDADELDADDDIS